MSYNETEGIRVAVPTKRVDLRTQNISTCQPEVGESGLPRFLSVDAAVKALRPVEPMHCLHPSVLVKNAALFLNHFPGTPYYAVKANPDPYVLRRLYASGVRCFDVASLGEVRAVRELFPNADLAFMHPVKSREAIREAYFEHGVRAFVLDSFYEMYKILEETKAAADLNIIVRLAMPNGSAVHPLSGKFGAAPDLAVDLLREIEKISYKVGLSFHVGSQTLDPVSYKEALVLADQVIKRSGVSLDILDVGGGFPIKGLNMEAPPLVDFFEVIREGLVDMNLPKTCQVWCEPGAGLSGSSSTLVVRVELRKDDALYINDGNFGNLFDLCWEKRRNEVRLVRPEQKKSKKEVSLVPYKFYGPTCESMDFMPGPFMLPADVEEGDWIAISGLGAYSRSFRTRYNGFYSDLNVEVAV